MKGIRLYVGCLMASRRVGALLGNGFMFSYAQILAKLATKDRLAAAA